jgi:16S rRNA G527 N7-methylase RsmG
MPDPLATYCQEVLRWNRRISLVSRQNPEERLHALVRECSAALATLPAALTKLDEDVSRQLAGQRSDSSTRLIKVHYVDIGSGAGLPGIVWWLQLGDRLAPPTGYPDAGGECWLLEPRGKRAWFLEQTLRKLKLPRIAVLEQRWGQSCPELRGAAARTGAPICWLISFKALRMEERDILRGWKVATGLPCLPRGDRLVIARFLPPDAGTPEQAGSEGKAAGAGWPAPRRRRQPFGPQVAPLGELELTVYRG